MPNPSFPRCVRRRLQRQVENATRSEFAFRRAWRACGLGNEGRSFLKSLRRDGADGSVPAIPDFDGFKPSLRRRRGGFRAIANQSSSSTSRIQSSPITQASSNPALQSAAAAIMPALSGAGRALPFGALTIFFVVARALQKRFAGRGAAPSASGQPAEEGEAAAPAPKGIVAWLKAKYEKVDEKYCLKKSVPMLFMFFLILFGYCVLRDTKDVLVITAPGSGAEAIPFLKTWIVVPAAILVMMAYTRAAEVLSREHLFYASVAPFVAFFGLFATVLYPMRHILHPHAAAEYLRATLPAGFRGPIAIFENWTFSLFYVLAEMWGSVILSMGFWSFANDICSVEEATRLYPVLGIAGNTPALFMAGLFVKYFSKLRDVLPAGIDKWGVSLKYLMGSVCVAGVAICGLYWLIHNTVIKHHASHHEHEARKAEAREAEAAQAAAEGPAKLKKKKRMSLNESWQSISQSVFLRNLAILVVCYGISINLVEIMWKAEVKMAFPNPSEYSFFMGHVSMITGFATFVTMVLSKYMLPRCGWGLSAMSTPVVIGLTSVAFLAAVLFPGAIAGPGAALGMSPLLFTCWIGSVVNALSKSTKYALFDPTKEMVYIPLDREAKQKGKAAVDVMGHLLGKSGGSFIQQLCLFGFGSLPAAAPVVSVLFFATVGAWMSAVHVLEKEVRPLFRRPHHDRMEAAGPGRLQRFLARFSPAPAAPALAPAAPAAAAPAAAGSGGVTELKAAPRDREAVVALLETAFRADAVAPPRGRHGHVIQASAAAISSLRPLKEGDLAALGMAPAEGDAESCACRQCGGSGLVVRPRADSSAGRPAVGALASVLATGPCPACAATGSASALPNKFMRLG
eukprot:tig00000147_g9461.t1